jgi:preprotein translocase subunit Sec61beta
MASNKVAMPMSSAGIVGMSSDMKIEGKEMDPKVVIIAIIILVVIVHVAGFVFPA